MVGSAMVETTAHRPNVPPRERILESAYELSLRRRGIRGVGIDEVIERAAVAKATLVTGTSRSNDSPL